MNLIAKIGFGTLITFTSLCFLPETTKAQTNQTLGQCINETRSPNISSKEAAELCINTLKFQEPIQTVGNCINETRSPNISSKEAGQFCQYLLQQQAQNQNRNNNQNSSNGNRTNVQLGGDPQAIADCMKKLMYETKPVCTRNSCARLSSPEDNANRGFGGWQWQTVRTNISESSAAQACQNAR